MGRPLLFYSAWPLGYHNPEAQRKALAFARSGYSVVYVPGIGVRNPRVSSLPKLADRLGRKLHPARDGVLPSEREPKEAAVLVIPPRQLPQLRRLNAAWVERQLRKAIRDWKEAVAWIRSPTPEVIDALTSLAPAAVVYECVDAYHHTPGITGRWAEIHERAERKLVASADAVVVPGEELAKRFRSWGADVRVVTHGVDLFPCPDPRPRDGGRTVIGFVGTLDYRLDMAVLAHIASVRPDWRLRLIGPLQEGFDPRPLDRFHNVSVEPPVPHGRLGEVLAGFDAGVMPYADTPVYHYMTPLKTLELLAAGRPVVARPSPALAPFATLVRLATTPEGFVDELERCVREDSLDLARRRRAVAAENTWDRRMEELVSIVAELLGHPDH